MRWYEIRNPASTPVVFQQGTVVNPAVDYWMGSIAMDKVGNIANTRVASLKFNSCR